MAEKVRAGRFALPSDVVFERWRELREFFAAFIVFHAESDECSRTIVYHAISDHFDPISRGELVPTYEVEVKFRAVTHHHYDGHTVKRLP